jgi:biopolymer transport protein ExbB
VKESSQFGITHFFNQTDAVGFALFITLALMSIVSWALIVARAQKSIGLKHQEKEFLTSFRALKSVDELKPFIDSVNANSLARVASAALKASELSKTLDQERPLDEESSNELVSRALQNSINDELAALEIGQTPLASIASTAPFIGLFGTVWGIYHALVSIGSSGNSSLDQVAGPVGEALIMTAMGLAVAIPAALAYNTFQRTIRLRVSQLDRFAHDLLIFVSTGRQLGG